MSSHRIGNELFEAASTGANKVPDPGASGTISINTSPAYVPLVSAAAETRTLDRPTAEGLFALIAMKTDGGDITLTVTGGYDVAGNTTFTFDDAGEFALFVSSYDGTNYYWRLIASAAGSNSATLDQVLTHLLSTQVVVPLSLAAFRETDASKDVGNDTANGGVLSSNTTPTLTATATTEHFNLTWAAGNTDQIAIGITLPEDIDDTQNAFIDLWVQADTTDQAPTFTVETSWGTTSLGSLVTDSASATTLTTMQEITATIAAADVPAGANFLTIGLTPATHGTSVFQLYGARLRYKRKLLTS